MSTDKKTSSVSKSKAEPKHISKDDASKEKNEVKNAPSTEAKKETSQGEGETYQAPPDTYNGGDCDIYSWSQTITDVDLRVRVSFFIIKKMVTLKGRRYLTEIYLS